MTTCSGCVAIAIGSFDHGLLLPTDLVVLPRLQYQSEAEYETSTTADCFIAAPAAFPAATSMARPAIA